MAMASPGAFLGRLTRGLTTQSLEDLSDQDLVERLLAGRDGQVFDAIVRRHGPMVYRVCWRVAQQTQDAEDAFQATFLVLAQKMQSVRRQSSLASWLHGIAYRVALKAKAQTATRRRHEHQATPTLADGRSPDDVTWGELRALLDRELNALADKWRKPLILCYLEGQTQDQAAKQLGWSKNTLRRRLDEARAALGRRLRRLGVVGPAALWTMLISDCAASAAPPALIGLTVEAARCLTAGHAAAAAVVSARVAALTKGVTNAMLLSKIKIGAMLLGLGLVLGLGAAHSGDFAQSEFNVAFRSAKGPAPVVLADGEKKPMPTDAKGVLVNAVRAARDIKADNDETRRRKVDFLTSLAHRQEKIGDRPGADTTFKEALTVAATIDDSEQRADAQSHVGFYQAHAGLVKEAADTAKGITIKDGKLKGDALKQHVEGLQGYVLAEIVSHLAITGKYEEALATAEKIAVRVRRLKTKDKEIIEEHRDTMKRDHAYHLIAKAQLKAGKTDEALKTFGKIEEWRSDVFLYQDILIAHGKGKDLATVRTLVAEFKKEMEKRQVPTTTRLYVLADVQGALGDTAGATEWIGKLDSPQERAEALIGLSIGLSRAEAERPKK
jgi:RNA polymerase sigma factor (sigma-70 family)